MRALYNRGENKKQCRGIDKTTRAQGHEDKRTNLLIPSY